MIVVPSVFRTIHDFFNAGDLGIVLFSALNNFELFMALVTLSILVYVFKKDKKVLPLLLLTSILVVIISFYFFYLTAHIAELTDAWKQTQLTGIYSIPGIGDIQQAHQSAHRIYVGLDVLKLLILSFVWGMTFFQEEKWK